MKRVLFIIETLRGGGAERALSNIVMHFPDDWCVDILINDKSLVEYPYDTGRLDLIAGDPGGLCGHQAKFAVGDKIASGGLALHAASMNSAVFYSLRQKHY